MSDISQYDLEWVSPTHWQLNDDLFISILGIPRINLHYPLFTHSPKDGYTMTPLWCFAFVSEAKWSGSFGKWQANWWWAMPRWLLLPMQERRRWWKTTWAFRDVHVIMSVLCCGRGWKKHMGAPRPPWRWCWYYHLESENLHHLNGCTGRQVHDGFCFTTAFASYFFNWASWLVILYWNLSWRQSSFSSFNVNNHGFSGTCGLLQAFFLKLGGHV